MPQKSLTIALAGNPNSGKTTIFNNLTGTRQKVGNWPGVTVEKKEGAIRKYGYDLKIIDLPGTYSLTPFSIEEIVARNFVLDENPDVVIDIIDASNLERSLYLATQFRELGCKVLFALNMADLARARGMKIDATKLSNLLDVPVTFTVGNKNEGIDMLLKMAVELTDTDSPNLQKRRVKYSQDIEKAIQKLKQCLDDQVIPAIPYNPRWTATKLLEDDKIVRDRVSRNTDEHSFKILELTDELRNHIRNRFDDDPEIVMTDERYGFIAGVMKEVCTTTTRQRIDISRNIDLVLTNRFVGFPIFVFFIWAMFQLTFTLGEYPMEMIDSLVAWISALLAGILPDSLVKDLVLDGILAGIGSVVIFLPNILTLFFCIALFEDTGYMARSAFLMDKIMHLIGLHGKSFIPMLMGFGCNVPAIMASRTHTVYVLFGQAPGLHCPGRYFFQRPRRHGYICRLSSGNCSFHADRQAVSINVIKGCRCAIRHGITPLSGSDVAQPFNSYVGPQQNIFEKNGWRDSGRFSYHLGPYRFPAPNTICNRPHS
jgi:ferrous iron transport protein B